MSYIMPHRHKELQDSRKRIDEIDTQILDLLAERAKTVQQVIKTKVENQLPVFVPQREQENRRLLKRLLPNVELNRSGPKIFCA